MLSAGNFLLLLIDYLFIGVRVSRWEWLYCQIVKAASSVLSQSHFLERCPSPVMSGPLWNVHINLWKAMRELGSRCGREAQVPVCCCFSRAFCHTRSPVDNIRKTLMRFSWSIFFFLNKCYISFYLFVCFLKKTRMWVCPLTWYCVFSIGSNKRYQACVALGPVFLPAIKAVQKDEVLVPLTFLQF